MTTIFLLAGESKRMGDNKMLLPFKGKNLFESTLQSALSLSDRIIAVLGRDEERIKTVLKNYDVEIRINRNYKEGQRSSILVGLEGIYDDVAILPGDLPLLKEEDWTMGLRYLSLCISSRPYHNGNPGHPVFIARRDLKGLETSSKPFKEYLEDIGIYKYDATVGAVFDIDTKEDFNRLLDNDSTILNG